MSDDARLTRCVKVSRWYLAGRWRPGQCFLVAGHPGEHSGAPAEVDWSPERAWMLAAKHGLPGGDPGPWRFDVPEVPDHITALEVGGCLIVRVLDMLNVPGGWWKQRFSDGTVDNAKPLSVWLQFAPLVECPDPRKDTTT
jgi:hypothetical protein